MADPPWFRDGPTRWAAAVTVALAASLEISDGLRQGHEADEVMDDGTVWVFLAALAAALGTSSSALRRGPRPRPAVPRRYWSGLALIWGGAAVNRAARRSLGQQYRSRLTVVDEHQVVTTGPYRYIRHPMYFGASLFSIGAALAVDSWEAYIGWTLPVAALVHRIRVEETMLNRSLGDSYQRFADGRSRLVPGLW